RPQAPRRPDAQAAAGQGGARLARRARRRARARRRRPPPPPIQQPKGTPMTTTDAPPTFDPAKVEAFAGQLMPILAGGLLSHLIDIGHRTGLFAAAAQGPGTSEEIAERAGLHERYVREWLSAMATSHIVEFDPTDQTFVLPPEHAALL